MLPEIFIRIPHYLKLEYLMSRQRIAVLIVAAVGMIATFLPWINISIAGSVPGSEGDGWITFVLFGVPLLLSLIGKREQMLADSGKIAALIASLLALALGVWKLIDLANMSVDENNVFAEALSEAVSAGIGLYLVVICGVLIPVVLFVIRDKAMPIVEETGSTGTGSNDDNS